MRKKDYAKQVTVDAVWRGEDIVLDIDILSIGNTGIGPYECHGRKGFDHGQDFIDEWSIGQVYDGDGTPVPKETNKAVIKEMEDDASFMDALDTMLQEKLADLVDDGEEED